MGKQRSKEPVEAPTADVLAFRAAVKDVTPLPQSKQTSRLTAAPKARARARRKSPSVAALPDVDMPLLPDAGGDAPTGSTALAYQRAGIQNQVMRKLRRGQFPLEAELDLHGLSQSSARDRLAYFLATNRDAGRRCVRIVHGKGYRSGARGPILKIAVDMWLRRHGDVLAFVSARPIDGGTGAVYVLLRT